MTTLGTTSHTSPRVARPSASRTAAILGIARTEAVRLVRHPAFLVGLAASLAGAFMKGEESWAGQNYFLVMQGWTTVWMGTLVAAALVAGRQRFLTSPDLFAATPSTPGDRVLGTALGLVAPALATAVAVAAVAVSIAADGGLIHGDPPYSVAVNPSLAEWAQPVLLVVVAGMLGILVAQLRRGRVAALIVATLATFVGGTAVWAFGAHPVRVLHPFMFPSLYQRLPANFSPESWVQGGLPLLAPDEHADRWRQVRFDTGALGWHLVYLTGLILVGLWAANRLADRSERSAVGWAARAGTPLVLVGGVAQILTAGIAG